MHDLALPGRRRGRLLVVVLMKGGARTRSGPPADPNALRRDRDNAGWIDLPAGGRQGDAPAWPLSTARKRESVLWTQEWQRPQAIVWEANGLALEVALYVRAVVAAEGKWAKAADRVVVLRHMDSLGLTEGGRAKNRWRLVNDAPGEATAHVRTDDVSRTSGKARFRAIAGGAA